MKAFLLICTLIHLGSPVALAADDSDVQSLLKEADSALQSPAAPSVPQKKRRIRKERPAKVENTEAPAAAPSAPAASKPPEASRIVPIDSPDLKEILSVDLSAKEREQSNHFPKSVVRITGGMNWIGNGYVLEKDDDTFQKVSGGELPGVYLQYNPSWVIPSLSTPKLSSSLTLATGVGFFRGSAIMRRSGVQSGDNRYDINLFPVDVEAGPVISLWRKVGIQATYGVGVEFFHQAGDGESDTTTQLFWSDTASVALRGYFSDTLEGYIGWKYRGLAAKNEHTARGNMLVAGVGFQFAD